MRRTVLTDVGKPNIPQDIRRFRREVGDMLRRMGEPVVHLHAYLQDDFDQGRARRCPACIFEGNNQPRPDCEICFGTGYVSIETDPNRWIDDNGYLTDVETDTPAPLYGGWGDPTLTRTIQPDVATDEFRLSESGVLTRVQQARGYTFWQPKMKDGDLLVNVALARDGVTVIDAFDRFRLRSVLPMTMRGWGVREMNRQHIAGQTFEMDRVEQNEPAFSAPIGGIQYGEF